MRSFGARAVGFNCRKRSKFFFRLACGWESRIRWPAADAAWDACLKGVLVFEFFENQCAVGAAETERI